MTPAAEALVVSHDRLVRRIARDLFHLARGSGVQKSDLLQWGRMGLMWAAQRYDPSHGWAFNSYARHAVRGHMLDCARQYRAGGHARAKGHVNHVNSMRFVGDRADLEALDRNPKDATLDEVNRRECVRAVRHAAESLTGVRRKVARLMLKDCRGIDICTALGFSEGRASQLRRAVTQDMRRLIARDHPSLAEGTA